MVISMNQFQSVCISKTEKQNKTNDVLCINEKKMIYFEFNQTVINLRSPL